MKGFIPYRVPASVKTTNYTNPNDDQQQIINVINLQKKVYYWILAFPEFKILIMMQNLRHVFFVSRTLKKTNIYSSSYIPSSRSIVIISNRLLPVLSPRLRDNLCCKLFRVKWHHIGDWEFEGSRYVKRNTF